MPTSPSPPLLDRSIHLSKWPWNYSGLPCNDRWWDLDLLSHGLSVPDIKSSQLDTLIYKLVHRQGIVVAAIGDSVICDLGGCWPNGNDTWKVQDYVIEPGFSYYFPETNQTYGPDEVRQDLICTTRGQGWISAFMEALDAIFPGNNNVLVNAAKGALPLWGNIVIGCLEAHLPKSQRPDLIIIENHEAVPSFPPEGVQGPVEQVIWRLLSTPLGPPTTLPPHLESTQGTKVIFQYPNYTEPLGDPGRVEPHDLVPAVLFFNTIQRSPPPLCLSSTCGDDMMEDYITPLLESYGFGAVSTRNILREMARRAEGVMNATEVIRHMKDKTSSIFMDQVHPTWLGRVLFTDLVMLHLLQTLDPGRKWDPQRSSRYNQTWAARYPPPQRYLPPKEFRKDGQGRQVFSQRCYGHTDLVNSRTGDFGNLEVLSMRGFNYTLHQMNGDTKKLKPGWVAFEAGSEMTFRVDTRFSSLSKASSARPPWPPNTSLPPPASPSGPKERPIVTIMFLHSYEHMGKAVMSCVKGCQCSPQEENFHEKIEHDSLLKGHSIPVTESHECDISIKVINSTDSGEHKVKLVQVVVRIPTSP